MKYEAPELELIEFDVDDIILTSDSQTGGGGENELPSLPLYSNLDLKY